MSHFVEVPSVKIMDLAVLEQAAHSCGLMLVRGQQTYHGYQWTYGKREQQACDHAIVSMTPNGTDGYEVGLVPAEGGGWTLSFDAMGAKLLEKCGEGMGKFLQAYSIGLIQKTAAQHRGQVLSQTVLPDGRVAVRVMMA